MGMKRSSIIIILAVIVLVIGAAYAARISIGGSDSRTGSDAAPSAQEDPGDGSESADADRKPVKEDGEYTAAEDVAEYIHIFHKLPSNYVTEKEAKKKGWRRYESPAKYGIMIGGKKYRNYEKKLPKGEYCECDVDYSGRARGRNRLVYTRDGTVYHTTDHYKSFKRLY